MHPFAPLLLLTFAAAPLTADATRALGEWTNSGQTRSVSRAIIRRDGGRIYVQMWGACGRELCDWANSVNGVGEQPAEVDASGTLYVNWQFPHWTARQTLICLPGGSLQVLTEVSSRERASTVTLGDILDRAGEPLDPHLALLHEPGSRKYGNALVYQLYGSGGRHPYHWSIREGALPLGITLNAETGEIRGEARESGDFHFTVELKDSANPPTVVLQKFRWNFEKPGALEGH